MSSQICVYSSEWGDTATTGYANVDIPHPQLDVFDKTLIQWVRLTNLRAVPVVGRRLALFYGEEAMKRDEQ